MVFSSETTEPWWVLAYLLLGGLDPRAGWLASFTRRAVVELAGGVHVVVAVGKVPVVGAVEGFVGEIYEAGVEYVTEGLHAILLAGNPLHTTHTLVT